MSSQSNPHNLPIISESSLHKITAQVKDYQLAEKNGKHPQSGLIKDAQSGQGLKTTDFFRVELEQDDNKKDEDKEVIKITAIKPFFWEKWDFTKEQGKMESDKKIVEYNFEIDFGKALNEKWEYKIEIGEVKNELNIRSKFLKNVYFCCIEFSAFLGRADFGGATFSGKADFQKTTFSSEVNFKGAEFSQEAFFWDVVFLGEAFFWDVIFSKEAHFGGAKFSEEGHFGGAVFSEEAHFGGATFYDAMYFQEIKINKNLAEGEFLHINLNYVTVNDKLIFSLHDDTNYHKTIISLHSSNINYFVCDDKELENIHLYWENPKYDWDRKLDQKTRTEKYIHELRVMRNIFHDLQLGDIADRYYAKIMRAQCQLGSNLAGWLKQFIFGWLFGWGVYLGYEEYILKYQSLKKKFKKVQPNLGQDLIKREKIFWPKKIFKYILRFVQTLLPTKGGILWSTLLLIVIFAIVYPLLFGQEKVYFDTWVDKEQNKNALEVAIQDVSWQRLLLLSTWNFMSVVLPDQQVILYNSILVYPTTLEAFLGIIWLTTLVAILARKFMRM